jgi:hypothetical protein
MPRKCTADDLRSICYFYRNKSVTNYIDWNDIKDNFFQQYPMIQAAMTQFAIAEFTLDALMQKLADEAHG